MSTTSGRRILPSYIGGTCTMYVRVAPPEGIISVLLPGFSVPAVHAGCAASGEDTAPLSLAGGTSTAAPPLPVDAPPLPVDAPPLPEPPLPAGAALPPLPDAPPEPAE